MGVKMNALTANERCEESDALLLREVVSIAVAKVVPETVSESGADFSSSIVALGKTIDGTFAGKREESVAFVRIKSSSSLNFTFIRILNPLLKTDLLITLSQQNDSARTSCRCCRCRRRQGRRGCRRERLQHVLVRWRLGIERHGSSIVRVIFHHRSSCLHSRVQRFNHEKIARIRVRELLASARCGESD